MTKKHLIFSTVAIFIVLLSYMFTPQSNNEVDISNLGFYDAIYISAINFGLTTLFVVLSFTGISFFFILAAIISMGAAGSLSGLSPLTYYMSSFFHGLGEIIVLSIIFWFSIDHIKILYRSIRFEKDMSKIKNFYLTRGTSVIGLLLIFSVVNGFIEVYLSNTLINFLT